MRLDKILKGVKYKVINDNYQYNFRSLDIKGIVFDSRKVKKDYLFIAIKGELQDGTDFIKEALAKGASAVVTESKIGGALFKKALFLRVKNSRNALLVLANNFFNNPAKRIKLIGVTGTNGKTTITYLIQKILERSGKNCGVIGTLGVKIGKKTIALDNTTPSPIEIYSFLDKMSYAGFSYCVLEVSSHALIQDRVNPDNFYAAIFTNLGWDHLDYHKTIRNYFLAKKRLFLGLKKNSLSILNADDKCINDLRCCCGEKVVTYGLDKRANFYASNIIQDDNGLSFKVNYKKKSFKVASNLLGNYSIYNMLASIAFCLEEKISVKNISKALKKIKVPGRMEKITGKHDLFGAFVDFAHTPDALKNVIMSLNKITKNRLIVVFGCGGNRDIAKRSKMGRIATELADFAVITSDNPRFEAPEKIIMDIEKGLRGNNYKVIPERKKAIHYALSIARRGDNILVAGKGHENYQIIKDKKILFSDKEQIKLCLKSKRL